LFPPERFDVLKKLRTGGGVVKAGVHLDKVPLRPHLIEKLVGRKAATWRMELAKTFLMIKFHS
jgi:hypothetical protein